MKFHQLTLEVQSLFQSAVINRANKLNLMPGQPKILDYLKEHNGSSLSEISRGCFLSNPTVTGLIERMEKTGLVERRHKQGDKRTSYIFLTQKGINELENIAEIFSDIENTALKGLNPEEKEKFLETLNKVKINLEEFYNEH